MAPKKATAKAASASAASGSSAKILEAFKKYDKNKDGTISKEELKALLSKLDSSVWSEKRLEKLVKAIDKDKNGKIDYDEFTKWVMGTTDNKDKQAVLDAAKADSASKTEEPKSESKDSKSASAADSKGDKKKEEAPTDSADADLSELMETIFKFFDEDQDGQLERVELLTGEEKRMGQLDFGPSERKKVIAWFKEAGAEGNPTSGMFLSKEKWDVAFKARITEEAEGEPLVEWLKKNYSVCLEPPKTSKKITDEEVKKEDPDAPREPPKYPITVPFQELDQHIAQAGSFDKTALVLSCGLNEVETFMSYQINSLVDVKLILNEVFISKSKPREEAQKEVRSKVKVAMNSNGFCKPLHIRMANSAFDWVSFCGEEVPSDIFCGSKMTVEHAHELGLVDTGHRVLLSCDDRWTSYQVVITSTFDLEKAQEFLADKLPHFSEMAIIIVDPESVKK